MGLRSWFSWLGRAPAVAVEYAAESTPRPIDQMFLEMRGAGMTVGRDEALTVPAMLRARNMICSISTLPITQLDARNAPARNPLLEQIDPNVPNVVTLAQTFEDLLMDAISWWEITAFGADGFPMSATRRDPNTVSLQPPNSHRSPAPLPSGEDPRRATVWVDGREVATNRMIRFDSPNPAVLKAAARSIRRAIRFEKAAAVYSDDFRALDYFSPAEGADKLSDPEVREILDEWKSSRKQRSTGYVPAALKYNTVDSPTPADLQLAELNREAKLDIANAMGVDPEDLGVSTTSRTYANAVDRRRDRINDVLAPYMKAVTDRLSMGDVTKRGYRVVFNLDDYLKSNPTERWNVYKLAKDMGVLSVDEIRAKEGEPEGATVEPVEQAEPTGVTASNVRAINFDTGRLQFAHVPVTTFSVDTTARTIEGVAMPYGKIGNRARFERGSLQFGDPTRVKLLRDHDYAKAVGYALELKDTPSGFKVKFKLARGKEADEVLELAEDGVLDGLSVGVDFAESDTIVDPKNKSGGYLVLRADLREVSLTAMPAFDDARVTRVAASLAGGSPMVCITCGHEHAPNVACPSQQPVLQPAGVGGGQFNHQPYQQPAQQPQQLAGVLQPYQQPAPPAPPAQQFTVTLEQMQQMMQGGPHPGLQANAPAPEQRQVVDPTGRQAPTEVTEPAPYRFDRRGNLLKGSHDFSQDLYKAFSGDAAAYDRAVKFVQKAFDVVTTNVDELNPTRQRPDLYVDQKDFTYPVWEAINKGTLQDITPFTFPKFSSASGLVGAHTEGTEPSSGTYVTTGQTVTPTAISGKAKLSREVWEQGGNPQVSNLIWRQMLKGWFESLEAAAVAVLDAATPTAIALTAGGGTLGQTLSAELEAAFAALQFIRGGFRFDTGFTQIDLYKALAAAKDDSKRPLYPITGPQNANGTTVQRFSRIDVAGVDMLPAWALAASGAVVASSYLFDSQDVHGWASSPQRLDIDRTEVANVYIGIWGYKATAISDITGVREITYDPVP
jgi:HK97 family phage prohead protease